MDITRPMSYGTFIDAMEAVAWERPSGKVEAELFFEQWKALSMPEQWVEYRDLPLGEGEVSNFVEDMVSYWWEMLSGTYTDELYTSRKRAGHQFLQAIHAKLTELGIIVPLEEVDVPLTPADFLLRSGHARIVAAEA